MILWGSWMLTEFSLSRRAPPVSNFVLKRRRVIIHFGSSETVSKVPPSSASSPVFCFVIYSILCQIVWQVMFCNTIYLASAPTEARRTERRTRRAAPPIIV